MSIHRSSVLVLMGLVLICVLGGGLYQVVRLGRQKNLIKAQATYLSQRAADIGSNQAIELVASNFPKFNPGHFYQHLRTRMPRQGVYNRHQDFDELLAICTQPAVFETAHGSEEWNHFIQNMLDIFQELKHIVSEAENLQTSSETQWLHQRLERQRLKLGELLKIDPGLLQKS